MIKVFVVEDEEIIRQSIIKNIPWEKEGLTLVGEAGDGELALSLITETTPDILITDVKMPFMDGLELSSIVKEAYPEIKIIILTGYRDFEYAKTAIKIGVTELLSKPITSQKLLESILKVKASIEKERAEKKELESLKHSKTLDKKTFLDQLLFLRLSIPELISNAQGIGLNIISPYYTMLLFKPMPHTNEEESLPQVSVANDQIIQELNKRENCILFDRGYEGFAILLKGKTEDEVIIAIDELTTVVENIFNRFDKLDFFGGIGSIENRLSSVYLSFLSANKAFSLRFFTTLNRFVDYKKTNMWQEGEINANAFNWNILENFFITGSKEEIPTFIPRYIDNIGDIEKLSISTKNHIGINAYLCAIAYLKKQNLSTNTLHDKKEELLSNRIIQESLLKIFTIVFYEKANSKPILPQIRKAQAFIQENVREYGISLNTVAEYVNMSPNYFSTIFAQETGKTFIEYLTSIRIDKACELLGNTNMKTIDISLEVGYQDSHYFSTLFKKEKGLTPREYRNKVLQNVQK